MSQKTVYKPFAIAVSAAGASYSKKFDLEKNVKLITGLQMSATDPKLLFYRGSQKIEISGEELYSEDFPSKVLMSGIQVNQNDRYVKLGEVLAGNGEVKVLYKDSENPNAAFAPYTVYLMLEYIVNR